LLAALLSLALHVGAAEPAGAVEFRNALDDSPLDLKPIAGETITDAVKTFYQTGEDPYVGNAEAVAKGKELFNANCQACHEADGSGGMCPALIGDVHVNARAGTDVGKFEIVHSGAAGAMKAFSKRGITQDQILQLIAYIHELNDKAKAKK
jgi:cytochrome c-L